MSDNYHADDIVPRRGSRAGFPQQVYAWDRRVIIVKAWRNLGWITHLAPTYSGFPYKTADVTLKALLVIIRVPKWDKYFWKIQCIQWKEERLRTSVRWRGGVGWVGLGGVDRGCTVFHSDAVNLWNYWG